jgi:hypothetical protein
MNELELAMFEQRELGTEERSLDEIAQSILRTKAKVQRAVVEGFARMGRDLKEAKSKVPYGEWGRWLAENVDFSERHAQDLMRIADEYSEHMSDSLMSLSITQATALLGLTAEQKEEFVATHDMETITTDELKAQVRELKEQLAGKQQTIDGLMEEREALREEANYAPDEGLIAELEQKLAAAEARAEKADETAKTAEANAAVDEKAAKAAKEDAAKARQEKAQLETQLQAYKQRAEVAEKQKKLTEEQLLEERSKGPRVEYQTPPEVEQELARLRAEAGRGESQIMVRKLIGDISRITGPLESELRKVAQQDRETGKKMMLAAAKIFLDLGEKLKDMAEGMGE